MSVAAWVRYLPEVHPFLVDTAQTVDRTIARFEGRIGVLPAELAQFPAPLVVDGDTSGNRAARAKRAAYQQEIVEYQATISQCRKQLEAQVADDGPPPRSPTPKAGRRVCPARLR